MNDWAECIRDTEDSGAEIKAPYSPSVTEGYLYIDDMCIVDDILPVTRIGIDAFSSSTRLIGVSIPSTVSTIGSKSFYKCEFLTHIEFRGDSCLKKIEGYAFAYIGASSTQLATVVLPSGVENIDYCGFAYVRARIIFCGKELKGTLFFNNVKKLEVIISSAYTGPLSALSGTVRKNDALCYAISNFNRDVIFSKRNRCAKITLNLNMISLLISFLISIDPIHDFRGYSISFVLTR